MSNNRSLGINIFGVLKINESDFKKQIESASERLKKDAKIVIPLDVDNTAIKNLQTLLNQGLKANPVDIINPDSIKKADEEVKKLKSDLDTALNGSGNRTAVKTPFEKILKDSKEVEAVIASFRSLNLGEITKSVFGNENNEAKAFTVTVKALTGEVEKFRYVWKEAETDKFENITKEAGYYLQNVQESNAAVQKLIEKQAKWNSTIEAAKTKYTALAEGLETLWKSSDGKNTSFFNQSHMESLSAQYNMLLGRIKELDGATQTDFSRRKAAVEAEISTIKALVAEYKSAEHVATSLRGVDPTKPEVFQKFQSEFEAFRTKVQTSGKGIFSVLTADISELKASLDSFGASPSKGTLQNFLDKMAEAKAKFTAENSLANSFEKISKEALRLSNSLNNLSGLDIFRKYANDTSVTIFREKIAAIVSDLDELRKNVTSTPADKRSESLVKYTEELERLTQKFNEANSEAIKFKNNLRNDKEIVKNRKDIQSLTAQITEYMNANAKAAKKYSGEFATILNGLKMPDLANNSKQIQALTTQFDALRTRINLAGDAGQTFGQRLVTAIRGVPVVGMYLSINSLAMRAVSKVREMIENVKELDTSMTALKRVTDETNYTYNNWLSDAAEQAKELHTSIVDLVDQTTAWVKLGNDLPTATKLAEISMMFSKVADVENETAVKELVSTMKAFNIEAEDSIRIVDMLDKLNNEFATSAKDLGEGLAVSASAMNVAGNSLEKTLALLTGGTEITQNAKEMAAALRTISMRIRSMKGELQDLGEEYENVQSLSKIQTQILNYTGVNIFDDAGNFRDTYDILLDISKVYNDLADTAKADLTEILFGKLRANQGVALLQAFETGQIQKAFEAATNSAGTATAEYEKWSDSIQAHLNTLTAAGEAFANAAVNGEDIKGIADAFTALLTVLTDIVKTFGSLNILVPTVAVALSGFKNIGVFRAIKDDMTGATSSLALFGRTFKQIKNDLKQGYGLSAIFKKPELNAREINLLQAWSSSLLKGTVTAEEFSGALTTTSSSAQIMGRQIIEMKAQVDAGTLSTEQFTANVKQMTAAQKAATASSKALSVVLNLGLSLAVMGAISLISHLSQKEKEAAENARKGAEEYGKSVQSIDDYALKIEELRTALSKEISTSAEAESIRKQLYDIQNDLIENYGLEKGAIDTVTDSIEAQTAALQELKKEKWQEYYRENSVKIEEAIKKMENANLHLDTRANPVLSLLENAGFNTQTGRENSLAGVDFNGSIYEALEAIDNVQAKIEELLKDDTLPSTIKESYQSAYEYLGAVRRDYIKKTIDENEDIYKQAIENSETYSGEYKKLLDDRATYEKALEKGNQEDINKTREAYYSDYINFMNDEDKGYSSAAKKVFEDTFGDIAETNSKRYALINKAIMEQGGVNSISKSDREFLSGLTDAELEAAANIPHLLEEGYDKARKALKLYGEQQREFTFDLSNFKNEYDAVFKKQTTYQSALDKIRKGEKLTADETLNLIELDEALANGFTKTAEGYTISAGVLENSYASSIRDVADELNGYVNAVYTKYNEALANNALTDELEEQKEQADALRKILEMFGLTADNTKAEIKQFSDTMKELDSQLSAGAKAQKEMDESGKISLSTYQSILALGDDYIQTLSTENGELVFNAEKFKELSKAKLIDEMATIRLEKAEANLAATREAQSEHSISAATQRTLRDANNKEKTLQSLIDDYDRYWEETVKNIGSGGGGSTSEGDTEKDAFDKRMKDIEHLYAMGLKSDEEYYDALEKANEDYYANSEKHESDYLSNIEKIYNGRQKLYKEDADKELAVLDEKLKLGYIKQEEYDKSIVSLAEKYYGKGTPYSGTSFADEAYKALIDKSKENDQSQYKESFEKELEELDKQYEKGIINIKKYRSEYTKLRETWWGQGSTWHGTTFAEEMYKEMSKSLDNVDELYEHLLDELKKDNDGTLASEREFISEWFKLIDKLFKDSDPAKYKENFQKYADYTADVLKSVYDKGLVTAEQYINEVNDLFDRSIEEGADLGTSWLAEKLQLDTYDDDLSKLREQYGKTLDEQLNFIEKWKELNSSAYKGKDNKTYLENLLEIGNENVELLKDAFEKQLISEEEYKTEIESIYQELLSEGVNVGKNWLENNLALDTYSDSLERLRKAYENTIEGQKAFNSEWRKLNETTYKDKDNTTYLSNLEEIAKAEVELIKREYEEGLISAEEYFDKLTDYFSNSDILGKDYISDQLKEAQDKRAEAEKSYWEEQKRRAENYYDTQIKKIKETTDEQEKANKQRELYNNLIEARETLEKAQKQRNQLIFENGEFKYVNDQEAELSAQEKVAEAIKAIKDNELSRQTEALEELKDKSTAYYDEIISDIDAYLKKANIPTESDTEILQKAQSSDSAVYDRKVRNGELPPIEISGSLPLSEDDTTATNQDFVAEMEMPDFLLNSEFGDNMKTAAKLLSSTDFVNYVKSLGGDPTVSGVTSVVGGAVTSTMAFAKQAASAYEAADNSGLNSSVNKALTIGDIVVNLSMNVQSIDDRVEESIQEFCEKLGSAVKTEITRTIANV